MLLFIRLKFPAYSPQIPGKKKEQETTPLLEKHPFVSLAALHYSLNSLDLMIIMPPIVDYCWISHFKILSILVF